MEMCRKCRIHVHIAYFLRAYLYFVLVILSFVHILRYTCEWERPALDRFTGPEHKPQTTNRKLTNHKLTSGHSHQPRTHQAINPLSSPLLMPPRARRQPPDRVPISRQARAAFGRRLRAWYRRNARDLPWRRTRDPYRVLISELMLQQTQVSRVTEKYHEFLERFPTLDTVAAASPRAVCEAWAGLGYYARARNLHALARRVAPIGGVSRQDCAVPALPADITALR